ncbi:MAG: hypothetical protein LIO46_03270, partial [Clostridiales bacterium]|nr:hypothetical protein [Clostridiales bacterium]
MEKIKLQMKKWGMTGRWTKSVLTVLIAVFTLYFLFAAYLVRSNYYTNVEKTIAGFSTSAATNHFSLDTRVGELWAGAATLFEHIRTCTQATGGIF